MLCNLAYVKNVSQSTTLNRLIYPVIEKCKVHSPGEYLYKFKERILCNILPQEVVRNETIEVIFQTYVVDCFPMKTTAAKLRHFTITILLSWKLKLCEKRRINIRNNHSPYMYLQCQPSWVDSTCAHLPSDIYGAKIPFPLCTMITLQEIAILYFGVCFIPSSQLVGCI